ncbi:MAG: AAA family ATPase [Candidatus Aenigmarchaeota archaeon]|nr:AAA family ATPase [Candidatus Aenigmarchaeota archaeon]
MLPKTLLADKIEINDQFGKALNLMENTAKNVFVTGRAGTGKSTLLDYFRKTTKKKMAVLAPTGVAAVNINGQTIHSFFRFGPDITPDKVRKHDDRADLYNALEIIVIDEISMVRADLLDCVDKALRLNCSGKKPFGGVQVVFIGDLYQLPPVVKSAERGIFNTHYKSQYFFDSKAFGNLEMEMIELEKIYRQKDHKFIGILNAIRNNSVTPEQLREINKRLHPDFEPKAKDFYINLTTTNDMADAINVRELSKLKSKPVSCTGKIKGSFDGKYLPTDIELKVKVGAQVMLLNNDPAGRWVNGTVGKIAGIGKRGKEVSIMVETQNRSFVDVSPYTWKMYSMVFNKETGSIDSEVLGSFTQYPIKLAWAVTIHKGQGKTFDRVVIDIGKGTFVHGQMYVALSRCTTLDGIVLKKPVQKKHIFMDWKIVNFLTKYQYRQSEKLLSLAEKISIIERAIKNKSRLEIVYLKSSDEKSRRTILPKSVGKMEYMSRQYTGVEGYCFSRKDNRVFRVDRILEIKEAG